MARHPDRLAARNLALFVDGAWDPAFAAAARHGVPVVVFLPLALRHAWDPRLRVPGLERVNYAELLDYLLYSEEIGPAEKATMLGGAARTWFNWEKTSGPDGPGNGGRDG